MKRNLLVLAAMVLWLPGILMAQGYGTLRGTVVKEDGKPVQGATVRVIGTTKGAISKTDGSFVIAGIVPGDYSIHVTSVGFGPHDTAISIKLDSISTVSITLQEKEIKSQYICRLRCRMIVPERNGTIHTITMETLERSPRAAIFGEPR